MEEFINSYLEAAKQAEQDCREFCEKAKISLLTLDPAQCGHDFWLTRNHYGQGFWARGLGTTGEKLTELAHTFKELSLYSYCGRIYFEV